MTAPKLPEHYSHSFLELFCACPAAAAAKLGGEPQVAPDYIWRGTHLHEGLSRHAHGCWERGVSQDKELMAQIAAGYEPQVAKSLMAFAAETRWPWRQLKAADVTECPVEQRWECALPNGARFVGVIDLALIESGGAKDNPFAEGEDLVRIVDWKSGRPGTWDDDEAPKQLLRYAVLYRRNNPPQHDYELLYGAPGWQGKWVLKSWQVSKLEVDRAERQLCGLIKRVRAEKRWEPNPGEACVRCLYTLVCPLRESATWREIVQGDPVRQLEQHLWHLAQAHALAALLKPRAQAEGPVRAGGYVYEGRTATSLVPVDHATFRQDADTLGVPWESITGGLQKNLLAKAAKALPEEMRKTFLGLLEERPRGRPTYKAYKLKGEDGEEGDWDDGDE